MSKISIILVGTFGGSLAGIGLGFIGTIFVAILLNLPPHETRPLIDLVGQYAGWVGMGLGFLISLGVATQEG